MTTLADMKASIAAEIYRDDLTDAIAAEIGRAITFYQRKRFFFNETRLITFNLVPGQEFYGATDEPRIPNLLQIDYVQVTQNGRPLPLQMTDAETMDLWTGTPASGAPSRYCYFERQIRVHPTPNLAYPLRISGLMRAPAPATDADDTNVWINEAEELIRSRAKRNLYLHHLADQGMASIMKAAEDEALVSLAAESTQRQNVYAFASDPL